MKRNPSWWDFYWTPGNALVVALSALILLFVLHRMVRRKVSPFDPLNMYLVMQTVPIGLVHMNIFLRYAHFGLITWLVIILSFLSFALGYSLGTACPTSAPPPGPTDAPGKPAAEILFPLAILLIALYLVGIHSIAEARGGFPMLAAHPSEAKEAFIRSRLDAAIFTLVNPALICSLAYLILGKSRLRKFLLLPLLPFPVVAYLLTGSRTYALLWIVASFVLYDLLIKRIRLGRVLLGALAFAVIFLVVGTYRSGFVESQAEGIAILFDLISSGKGRLLFRPFYDYFCNGMWNMNFGFETLDTGRPAIHTWGLSASQGLLQWVGLFSPMADTYRFDTAFNESILYYFGLNASSYQWVLFKDFGVAGICLGPLFIGFLLQAVHRQTRASRNVGLALLYAFLSYQTLMAWGIFWTVEPTMFLTFACLFLIAITLWLKPPSRPNA